MWPNLTLDSCYLFIGHCIEITVVFRQISITFVGGHVCVSPCRVNLTMKFNPATLAQFWLSLCFSQVFLARRFCFVIGCFLSVILSFCRSILTRSSVIGRLVSIILGLSCIILRFVGVVCRFVSVILSLVCVIFGFISRVFGIRHVKGCFFLIVCRFSDIILSFFGVVGFFVFAIISSVCRIGTFLSFIDFIFGNLFRSCFLHFSNLILHVLRCFCIFHFSFGFCLCSP